MTGKRGKSNKRSRDREKKTVEPTLQREPVDTD
jgi:hypothetical protein